ncbi:hypothetical protein K474DRAFT_1714327 [Panus rudis PR-1116 ss-1]|nr:hypothetical protein K474DRAFT_1714327 [Panus rudis PR-1116 ss-1]
MDSQLWSVILSAGQQSSIMELPHPLQINNVAIGAIQDYTNRWGEVFLQFPSAKQPSGQSGPPALTTIILCSLRPLQCEHQPLNVHIPAGMPIILYNAGPNEIHLLGNILHTSPDTTTQCPVSSNQPAPAVVPAVAPPNQENPQAQNPDPPAKAVASPLPQASPALTTNMISGMRLPKEIDVSDHKIGVGDPVKRGDTVSVRYRVQYPDPLQPGKTVDFQSNLTDPEPYTFVVDPDGPDAGKALRSVLVPGVQNEAARHKINVNARFCDVGGQVA